MGCASQKMVLPAISIYIPQREFALNHSYKTTYFNYIFSVLTLNNNFTNIRSPLKSEKKTFHFFLIKTKFSILLPLVAWYPTTVSTGIAVIRYNLAVAYAIRGELDKSGETLKQVSIFIEMNIRKNISIT